jgi:hypothetical protein
LARKILVDQQQMHRQTLSTAQLIFSP